MRLITVRRNVNSCILRWTYRGQDYSLTWGKWNNKIEKARLEICAGIIYRDCLADEFDPTLTKYKSWLLGVAYSGNGSQTQYTESKFPPLINLLEERIKDRYNSADDALLKLLYKYKKIIKTPVDAKDFMRLLDSRGVKESTKKRYLAILQVLRRDLFGDIQVKVTEKPKPKPFTQEEIKKILDSLNENKHYSHYQDFILFLFNTGTRPSEAIGLLWRDVDLEKREIHIYESLVRDKGNSSKRIRKSTKTGKYRIIPINNTLYQMLIKKVKGKDTDLVFTSPSGKPIDDHNLSQRCWKNTLKTTNIPHRSLYCTRSTFVSHCINSGMLPNEVAAITGHDTKVLFEHYLGSIKKPKLPEL